MTWLLKQEMQSVRKEANFILGPKSNSHPRRPKSTSHHVHSVARQLFAEMPQRGDAWPCVAAMPELRPHLAAARPCALLDVVEHQSTRLASLPLALTPCSLPLALSSLPCSCPPWPATLKLVAAAFPCPRPPSTQMDRRTTFLSPRRASGPPLPTPLAADAPRRRSSCRRRRGYCGRATTGRVGPS